MGVHYTVCSENCLALKTVSQHLSRVPSSAQNVSDYMYTLYSVHDVMTLHEYCS